MAYEWVHLKMLSQLRKQQTKISITNLVTLPKVPDNIVNYAVNILSLMDQNFCLQNISNMGRSNHEGGLPNEVAVQVSGDTSIGGQWFR